MCTRACTWWAYGDWIKLFGPCWPTDWICKSVFFVWWQCDASMTRGARNVLPVMCGRGVKACFWLREFRLAAWPRFLFFPAQGIHGNICLCACARVCVCVCVSVCLYCMCMKVCKCTSPLFSTTEKALSCPGTGHAECHQLSKCMSMHMWIYVSECGICAFDETFWNWLLPKNTRISNRILYFCKKMQLQQLRKGPLFRWDYHKLQM